MAWKSIPDHARAALAHLAQKFAAQPGRGEVDLTWARNIVAKYQRGESVAQLPLDMACQALRIPYPPKKESPNAIE